MAFRHTLVPALHNAPHNAIRHTIRHTISHTTSVSGERFPGCVIESSYSIPPPAAGFVRRSQGLETVGTVTVTVAPPRRRDRGRPHPTRDAHGEGSPCRVTRQPRIHYRRECGEETAQDVNRVAYHSDGDLLCPVLRPGPDEP